MTGGVAVAESEYARFYLRTDDERVFLRLKTIVAYESERTGRTIGQATYDLVMKAADVESYPEEVRERLDEIDRETREKAVRTALELSEGAGRGVD